VFDRLVFQIQLLVHVMVILVGLSMTKKVTLLWVSLVGEFKDSVVCFHLTAVKLLVFMLVLLISGKIGLNRLFVQTTVQRISQTIVKGTPLLLRLVH
jgi:hypothetical protein